MSDYIALGVIKSRHEDMLQEADEYRLGRSVRRRPPRLHRLAATTARLWHAAINTGKEEPKGQSSLPDAHTLA